MSFWDRHGLDAIAGHLAFDHINNAKRVVGMVESSRVVGRSPAELTTHRRSLNALTGIRFLAALYVVLYHSRLGPRLLEHGYSAIGNFCGNGGESVSLFFLLSGFILAYTYSGQIKGAADRRRFWEARFARLWPVYMVSLLLCVAVSFVVPKPSYAVAAVFMVQAWNPFDLKMSGAINPVCWTLSTEAFFYLFFPFLQPLMGRIKPSAYLAVVALMLAPCVWLNLSAHGFGYYSSDWVGAIPLPLLRSPEFIAGVAIGNYFLARNARLRSGEISSLLSGKGIWTYCATLAVLMLLCLPAGRWSSVDVIAFCALIFGLAAETTLISRMLSTKTMVLGGGISYSVYLIQNPIKDITKMLAGHQHVESEALRLLVMIILLLVVSYILFVYVEMAARDRLRTWFARLEANRKQSLAEKIVASKQ